MGTRKREDAATVGDLEDALDKFAAGLKGALGKAPGPKVKDAETDDGDDEGEDNTEEYKPKWSLSESWFGKQ